MIASTRALRPISRFEKQALRIGCCALYVKANQVTQ
jgi:hypothetical protein